MNWRLTRQFLLSTVLIVIFITIINTVLLIGTILYEGSKNVANEQLSASENTAANFNQYIQTKNNKPVVTDEGQRLLRDKNAWVQILDRKGNEVAHYFTPKTLSKSYTPVEIVQMYKYKMVDGKTIVFVGEAGKYSYFFGVSDASLNRIVYNFNLDNVLALSSKLFILFLIVDILIATIIGILFGRKLTKPLHRLIEGIGRLKNKDYSKQSTKKGPYKEVFDNMNDLSNTLQSVDKQRRELDVLRNEWISNVSHDMKTPLASIQGYAELMQHSSSDLTAEEIEEYTQIIENKSHYMKALLDDLNLTTKLKSGMLPLQRKETNIVHFIRELTIEVLNDTRFMHRTIEFNAHDINRFVSIDQNLMKRALMNFIYNALIHNSDDTVVTIELLASYPQNFSLDDEEKLSTKPFFIEISDNGNGIPEEDVHAIFERYYRGTNTTNTIGSGLGMAIARDIILAHEGHLQLQSKQHEGTSIFIQLQTDHTAQ